MDSIIQKAIDGGYKPHGVALVGGSKIKGWSPAMVMANYYGQPTYIFDPLFWESLGRTCGWMIRTTTKNDSCTKDIKENPNWRSYAQMFYSMILTVGWESAVEYLLKATK